MKHIKYLGIRLINFVSELHTENYQGALRDIKGLNKYSCIENLRDVDMSISPQR